MGFLQFPYFLDSRWCCLANLGAERKKPELQLDQSDTPTSVTVSLPSAIAEWVMGRFFPWASKELLSWSQGGERAGICSVCVSHVCWYPKRLRNAAQVKSRVVATGSLGGVKKFEVILTHPSTSHADSPSTQLWGWGLGVGIARPLPALSIPLSLGSSNCFEESGTPRQTNRTLEKHLKWISKLSPFNLVSSGPRKHPWGPAGPLWCFPPGLGHCIREVSL